MSYRLCWLFASGIRMSSILIPLASSQHNLYDIYLLLCVQCWTPGDGQRNCPKHVQFYSRNKIWEIIASRWFYYKINFDIFLPFTLGYFKCCLFLRLYHQNPVRISSPYMPHASPISFSLILSPEYNLVSVTKHAYIITQSFAVYLTTLTLEHKICLTYNNRIVNEQ